MSTRNNGTNLVEMDAKALALGACLCDGDGMLDGLKRKDMVPDYIPVDGYTAARDVAKLCGFTERNPHGPTNNGSLLLPGANIPLEWCNQFSEYELMYGDDLLTIFAEFHFDVVQDILMGWPGVTFTKHELTRDGGGPCTEKTWPKVRDMLNDDLAVDKEGIGKGRTYRFTALGAFGGGDDEPMLAEYIAADLLPDLVWIDTRHHSKGVA